MGKIYKTKARGVHMKKGWVFMFIFSIILLTNFISADINLDPGKQGECIELKQTCDNCTYVNISTVSRTGENATTFYFNEEMTKFGVDYNYSFCNTNILGNYMFTVTGDKDGSTQTESGYFLITPSGRGGSDNIVFFVIIIVIVYGIALLGFFGKNQTMSMIGGGIMILLGIYFINEGIVIYRDNLTNYLSYVTIGLGFFFTMYPILEEYFDF